MKGAAYNRGHLTQATQKNFVCHCAGFLQAGAGIAVMPVDYIAGVILGCVEHDIASVYMQHVEPSYITIGVNNLNVIGLAELRKQCVIQKIVCGALGRQKETAHAGLNICLYKIDGRFGNRRQSLMYILGMFPHILGQTLGSNQLFQRCSRSEQGLHIGCVGCNQSGKVLRQLKCFPPGSVNGGQRLNAQIIIRLTHAGSRNLDFLETVTVNA